MATETVAEPSANPDTAPPFPADADQSAKSPPAEAAPAAELSREETLQMQVQRLERELAAMVDQRKRTVELVDEIDRADDVYETAKDEARRAKLAREAAKASLRALVKGDATVEIDFNAKDNGKHAPGPTMAARDHDPVGGKHRDVVGTWGVWQFGLSRADIEKCDVGTLKQTEAEFSKRKVEIIRALGDKPFVPLEQVCFEDGSGYFILWPLLDVTDWNAICADRFAHPVKDLADEAPDITAKRSAGGRVAGYMVKNGRQRYVVAPDDQAIRVVYAPDAITGTDGAKGGFLAAQFLAAPPEKQAEVLSFPASQMADRMEARLREYQPLNGTGYHEALADALAQDLKVSEAEIVKAAKADAFRFEVRLDAAFSTSVEVVRLLMKDAADGAAAKG